ncbi:DUF3093 domain-containing protein [Arthrobacter jiangjiafuii]|uniref:DUF3093 domain-containing protein n=1 Tax=Arthrobacter jiangjiafuii TaxID=2817475 RepID=A0A975R290_9MICC|nr:DUF3093 domain-containing protein [Arthrobacter jiangjiafuii]MBP3044330.1 DUF3093 domain-containing protein [Arthrobacter jiangjiafuii]QWC11284.1 DUF3093 domain-containing protein [Arthrobacter jiangjiafuii]
MSSPSAQTPANTVLYSERLSPSFWIWVLTVGAACSCILIFLPISLEAGLIAAGVALVILIAVLLVNTPVIRVTADTLQVGRAEIERRYIGTVEGFRGDDAVFQRGRGLNGTAFMCFRGWISPVVRIEITDPADRTPYWLTSTRHPEELVRALSS